MHIPPQPRPEGELTLVPSEAFTTPPSQSGVRVRLWDRNWNLVADNAIADQAAADFMEGMQRAFLTVDTDSSRRGFVIDQIASMSKFGGTDGR